MLRAVAFAIRATTPPWPVTAAFKSFTAVTPYLEIPLVPLYRHWRP